jgi:uroporphyrinogen-III synthase
VASSLEEAGAEIVAVPRPITPVARVVMRALPLTGCVMLSRTDVEGLDAERDGLEWRDGATVWCLGAETAERAEARRWPAVQRIEAGASASELVERIRAHVGAA